MNRIIGIFFVLLFCGNTMAQEETLLIAYSEDSLLFRKLINEQFSSLITGQSETSIGTYASYDYADDEASLSFSKIGKKGHVFELILKGDASETLLPIFNEADFNENLSVELDLNLLGCGKKEVTIDYLMYKNYLKKKTEIDKEYEERTIEIDNGYDSINLCYKKIEIEKQRQYLQTLNSVLKNKPTIDEKEKLRKDSVACALAILDNKLKIIKEAIENIQRVSLHYYANRVRSQKFNELKPEYKVSRFKVDWVSINAAVSKKEFKLFDATQTFDNQVVDTFNYGFQVGVLWNKYNWDNDAEGTYFFSGGLSVSLSDNFSGLSKKEITESVNYSNGSNDRTITKESTVYSGTYNRGLLRLKLYGEYYRFFLNNSVALHINPEYQYCNKLKPLYNLGVGVLLSLEDSKNQNRSKVNAEIYYKFLDIPNNSDSKLTFLKRNSLGISLSFPIKFL